MKKILIFLTVLLLFLSFSTVQAEDNSTRELSHSPVSEKAFDAIQTAVNDANESDVILLEGTYSGNRSPINIDKSITIEGSGNGAILNAKSVSQIFKITSDNVILKNLVMVNGNPNTASGNDYGGAIEASGNGLKIINCNFSSNTARYGGAVYASGSDVSIIDCQFKNNNVEYTGAAVEFDGNDCYIGRCTFISNAGGHAGGDVAWVGSNGILINSTFISQNNKAKSSQFGGAVVWMGANGQLLKSSFFNYYAKLNGSAVYWRGTNGTMNYNIFINTDSPYWGNPDYAEYNYWGFNINSTEEFVNESIIAFSKIYMAPQNWINIASGYDYANFVLNTGETLKDYLPNYRFNSTAEIINNTYKFKKETVLSSSNLVTYSLYDGKYFKVTLTDIDGVKLDSKKVKITINGVTYTRTTNSQGVASLKISLKNPKTYAVSIAFGGDDNYKAVSKQAKVTVKKQKPVLTINTKTLKLKSKTKIIKVTFKNQFKKAISKTNVKITINKKTYTAKTNSKGIALFKVNLKNKKTYKVTAKFLGNAYYYKVSKTGSIKVK